MWKDLKVGQRLRYVADEFDGKFECECTVSEVNDEYAIAHSDDRLLVLTIDDDTEHMFHIMMSPAQVIEEMEVFLDYFSEEFGAVPICMTEAIRLLKKAD